MKAAGPSARQLSDGVQLTVMQCSGNAVSRPQMA
jgi:hypothetical protein